MKNPETRSHRFLEMVGEVGFEPATFWSRTKRATRLRYSPKENDRMIPFQRIEVNVFPDFVYLTRTARSCHGSRSRTAVPYFSVSGLPVAGSCAIVAFGKRTFTPFFGLNPVWTTA